MKLTNVFVGVPKLLKDKMGDKSTSPLASKLLELQKLRCSPRVRTVLPSVFFFLETFTLKHLKALFVYYDIYMNFDQPCVLTYGHAYIFWC
jgi:hypothetical protein